MSGNTWIAGIAAQHTEKNAGTATKNLIEARSNARYDEIASLNWNDRDIIGINANKITSDMIPAIENYVKKVENHLNEIDASANQNKAFQGQEVQTAVKNYIENVKTYCKNLTTQLRHFEEKLVNINATWEANRRQLAENIGASANSQTTGEEYVYNASSTSAPSTPRINSPYDMSQLN